MTRESQQQEEELIAAGWRPSTAHPCSPTWLSPDGVLMPGPGFAHMVMLQQKGERQ